MLNVEKRQIYATIIILLSFIRICTFSHIYTFIRGKTFENENSYNTTIKDIMVFVMFMYF